MPNNDSFVEDFPSEAPPPAPARVSLDETEVIPQPTSQEAVPQAPASNVVYPQQNVNFSVSPMSQFTGGGSTDSLGDFPLPNQTLKQLTEAGRNISENLDPGMSEELIRWTRTLREGLKLVPSQDTNIETDYQSILSRPGSEFVNVVHHNGHEMRSTPVDFDTKGDLSAERGELLMTSYLGQGTPMKTALWGSGFWISMKAPNEDDLLLINHILGEDKITFGRESFGAVFGNTTAYTKKRLVDFAISKIYATSIIRQPDGRLLPNNQTLEDLIVDTDYPLLLNALNSSMYPRGMRYNIACTHDMEKCKHVNEGVISPAKLELTDKNMLSTRQLDHMTKRKNQSMTLESVNEYQQAMNFSGGERITAATSSGGTLALELRVPKLSLASDLGIEWIEAIVALVAKATNENTSDDERESMYRKFAMSSKLLDYHHWVHSLTFGEYKPLTSRAELRSKLALISSDPEATKNILEAIMKFIVKTTVSVVAVPVVKCSNCQNPLTVEHEFPQFKNAIILDLQTLFFAQLSRRIMSIASRLEGKRAN